MMSAQRVIGYYDNEGENFTLTEPFVFIYKGVTYTIDAGFVTDFASIPRFFWRLIPKAGRHRNAAVIHDWLYKTGILTRKEADKAFRYFMEIAGVSSWKRAIMYRAVRVFGWRAWNKHRKQDTFNA